jgi:holo-[acyl-carrier protein] synthase
MSIIPRFQLQGGTDMILGIGTDLCNIERIEKTLARFGQRFQTRVYTEREQAKANSRPRAVAATYAKRWAAKEACSKALGTGLRMGISWKDMAVSNLRSGQPVMRVTGWAAERLAQMTPPGHEAVIHVTLTDDHPWAQAFVVIEARPLSTLPLAAGPGLTLTEAHSKPPRPFGKT